MTDRTKIARHFVDSSAWRRGVLEFGGVLKKIGIEWNRTADLRMVLRDKTVHCRGSYYKKLITIHSHMNVKLVYFSVRKVEKEKRASSNLRKMFALCGLYKKA